MNIPTSTTISSARNRAIKSLWLGAMALAVSGFATAHEAAPQPASTTYQAALQAKIVPTQARDEAASRSNWNVDYPSQLAPQPVRVASNATINKVASTVDQDANEQF
ncbi:hypothetical protein [Dyella sp. EPa41]|uniref:hypothetical protein n=1 Tax=Dyella sp. EPa41 TaxID=1561194 RepID=UPI0019155EA9|nr:hypothetical protein [Dyella sp. EPa41]